MVQGRWFCSRHKKRVAELSIERYIYRPMNHTPFFPSWLRRLTPMGSRTTQAFNQVRAYTLCQLENCFGQWLPENLFPKAAQQANSRDRHYTRWRTFWCSLWQNLNPEASCREVV